MYRQEEAKLLENLTKQQKRSSITENKENQLTSGRPDEAQPPDRDRRTQVDKAIDDPEDLSATRCHSMTCDAAKSHSSPDRSGIEIQKPTGSPDHARFNCTVNFHSQDLSKGDEMTASLNNHLIVVDKSSAVRENSPESSASVPATSGLMSPLQQMQCIANSLMLTTAPIQVRLHRVYLTHICISYLSNSPALHLLISQC